MPPRSYSPRSKLIVYMMRSLGDMIRGLFLFYFLPFYSVISVTLCSPHDHKRPGEVLANILTFYGANHDDGMRKERGRRKGERGE